MNFETLIEALTCPLNNVEKSTETGSTKLFTNTKHFLDIPKYLPCCHRTACNKCIIKYLSARRISTANTDYIYNCPLCKITSRISLSGDECKLEDDELAKIELERNLNDINHYLVKKLETSMKNIEGFNSKASTQFSLSLISFFVIQTGLSQKKTICQSERPTLSMRYTFKLRHLKTI